MNQTQFENQINDVSDLYEAIKEGLHVANGATLTMDQRKKYVDAFKHLQTLRDTACVALKELVVPQVKNKEDLHKAVRDADVHLSRCLFEMNKPIRNQGEPDEDKVNIEARKAMHKLQHALTAKADAETEDQGSIY